MKIRLELSEEQLGVVLSTMERRMRPDANASLRRGKRFARAALKAPPHELSYDIACLAPVYLQLVAKWKKPHTVAGEAYDRFAQVFFGQEGFLPDMDVPE